MRLRLVLAMALVLALGPVGLSNESVSAHENQTQAYHDGVCYWWGQQQWIGFYGQEGTAKGVTSLWDGSCTKVRVKLRYRTSQSCTLVVETRNPPAHAVTRNGYHTDYSDADVLLGGIWYGFRVDHPGSC